MANLPDFSFQDPITDTIDVPTKPTSETQLRQLLQGPSNELADLYNNYTKPTVNDILKKYYARATQNAGQTINAGVNTKVLFQVEGYDSQSEYDPATSKYTAKTAGIILVNASVVWGSQTDQNPTALFIYKNGVKYSQIDYERASGAGVSKSSGSGQVLVAVNDYIEIYAYTTQQLATSGDVDTFVEFCKIA